MKGRDEEDEVISLLSLPPLSWMQGSSDFEGVTTAHQDDSSAQGFLAGLGASTTSSTIRPQEESNEEDVDIEGRDEDEVLSLPEPLKVAPQRLLESGDSFELSGDVDAIIVIADTADMAVGRFKFTTFVLFLALDRLQNVSRSKLSLLRNGDFNPCTPKEEVGLEGFINCTVCKMEDVMGAQYSLTIFVIANQCLHQNGFMKNMYLETIAEVMQSIRFNHKAFGGAEKRKIFEKMCAWPPHVNKEKGTNATARNLSNDDGQSFFWVWTKMLETLLHDYESLPHPPWEEKEDDEKTQRLDIVHQLRYHALYLVQSIGCKEVYRICQNKTLKIDSDIGKESKQVLKEVFNNIPFVATTVSSSRCPILVDLAIDITPIGENTSFFFNGDRLSEWLKSKKKKVLDGGGDGDGSGSGSEDDNSSSGSDDNIPVASLAPNAGVRIFNIDMHQTYLDRDEEEDGDNVIHEDNGEHDDDDDDDDDDSDDEDDSEAYDEDDSEAYDDWDVGGDNDDGNEDDNGDNYHNDDTIYVLGYGAKKGYTFPICATRRVLANGQLPGRTKFHVHYTENVEYVETPTDTGDTGEDMLQNQQLNLRARRVARQNPIIHSNSTTTREGIVDDDAPHVEYVETPTDTSDTGEDMLQDQQLTPLTHEQQNSRARRAARQDARRNTIIHSNSTSTREDNGDGIVDDDHNRDTNDDVTQQGSVIELTVPSGKQDRVITTAVCYSPIYKATTLSQTRKIMQQTTENLPYLLSEIFSAIDELPLRAYKLAKDAIENLQKMFEGVLWAFKVKDNHWGRIEGTFLLDGNKFPQVESVFDASMLECISCVKTADMHAMTERIGQYYMKPLVKLLENMTEIVQARGGGDEEEVKTKAFYQTYQGGISAAVVEAAEIALCCMQVSKIGPLKGSILYESRKVGASECHIWTSFLRDRQALNQQQKCLTSLTYGLDPSAMPEKKMCFTDSRVTGVNKFQMQRLNKEMRHPDLYIWAMSRLSIAFSKLSKTALTSRLLINLDDMLLNGELSSQNVKDFQEEVVSMLYTIHTTEMYRYALYRMRRIRRRGQDGDRLPEEDELPSMPRTKTDLVSWGRITHNYVTLCNSYRGSPDFRSREMILYDPAHICQTMFGPDAPPPTSGWHKSPSHILYYKVIKKQLGELETLWNGTHGSNGPENPFRMLEMQKHIALHAGIQGWVWLTTASRQGRFAGAGVPVVYQNKNDMGVVAEGMRNELLIAPTAPPRYLMPRDNFGNFFTTPSVLDMLVVRALVNSHVVYIKEKNHCPTTTAHVKEVNAVAKSAFDQYFMIANFYTREQWSTKLNGWGKKKLKVTRIFTECKSIGEVSKLKDINELGILLLEKALQPLTVNPSAKKHFELLQGAINGRGVLADNFGVGSMNDYVWPMIESTTDDQTQPAWNEIGEWKQEMEDLWKSTLLKTHVQHKMGTLRQQWQSDCDKCTRASDDWGERKKLAEQMEQYYKIYVVDTRSTWGDEKKLLEYLFKENPALTAINN
jgi:hypothetical protein